MEAPKKGDALRSLRTLDPSGTSLWWRCHVSRAGGGRGGPGREDAGRRAAGGNAGTCREDAGGQDASGTAVPAEQQAGTWGLHRYGSWKESVRDALKPADEVVTK